MEQSIETANHIKYAALQTRFKAAVLDGIFVTCLGSTVSIAIGLILLHYKDPEMGGIVLLLVMIANTVIYFLAGALGFIVPLIAIAASLRIMNIDPMSIYHELPHMDVAAILIMTPGLLPLIIAFLYQIVMERSSQQSTFGKRIMGLAVVNRNGSTISLSRAIFRYFFKGLSLALCGIPQIMLLFGAEQTLYDKISGCRVIKTRH